MITGLLSDLPRYKNIHPNLAKAIEHVPGLDLESLPPGTCKIDGDDIFYMVNEYSTRAAAACEPERHRKFTDIQIMIAGEEKFGYLPFNNQQPSTDFLPDNDVAFYTNLSYEMDYITLRPGRFIIFFPGDIHQPEVFVQEPAAVRKLVVKVNTFQQE